MYSTYIVSLNISNVTRSRTHALHTQKKKSLQLDYIYIIYEYSTQFVLLEYSAILTYYIVQNVEIIFP